MISKERWDNYMRGEEENKGMRGVKKKRRNMEGAAECRIARQTLSLLICARTWLP